MTVILFVVFMGAVALSIEFGPDKIRIDDTTKATNRYIGVDFDHSEHIIGYEITCITCHHEQNEDFVSGSAPKCSICHNETADVDVGGYKDAMHKSCVICHIDETAMGKNPPMECLDCHIERK
jgi:hypothetical protein